MPMSNGGLDKLIEEIGELGQVIGKLNAFPTGPHPDGGPPLEDRLVEEMGDVLAAITLVGYVRGLEDRLDARYQKKLKIFMEWQRDKSS